MKKTLLLGVFAVVVVSLIGMSVHAQPPASKPTYGKESTTVRVAAEGADCVVTEAPGPIGTKWNSLVTVVILGECGGPNKKIDDFRVTAPMSGVAPSSPVKGDLVIRKLAPDVVVIEAHIVDAPARGSDRVDYDYAVFINGKPVEFRPPTRANAQAPRSRFSLSVCPMWPCE